MYCWECWIRSFFKTFETNKILFFSITFHEVCIAIKAEKFINTQNIVNLSLSETNLKLIPQFKIEIVNQMVVVIHEQIWTFIYEASYIFILVLRKFSYSCTQLENPGPTGYRISIYSLYTKVINYEVALIDEKNIFSKKVSDFNQNRLRRSEILCWF